jgi:hypothetical protein
MKPILAALVCLSLTASIHADSFPRDNTQPADPPRFGVGWRVRWSDGSLGEIVGPARWDASQWFYTVQFGGPESLYWSLPEQGLELADEDDGQAKRR